jgi:hypothetical protein
MSKFLLNLLVLISKALVYSKIQFLFEKEFSSDFGPSGPAPPALARFTPQAAGSPLNPFGPSSFGVSTERRISFDFAHSGRDAFHHSRHCHVGPACQLHPLPHAGQPIAASPRRLWPPCVARPPTMKCQGRSSLPVVIPPFHPPHNPSLTRPPSMALRPLLSAVSPLLTPACPSLAPIKWRAPTSGFTGPLASSLLFSPRPSTARTERLLHRFFPTDARPFPSLRRPHLQRVRLTTIPSPFFLNRGEVPRTGALFRPFSGEPPQRPCPRSTTPWTRSTEFFVVN